VLAIPFVDLLLAVIRRVRKRRSPFAPDKQHLHHRLLALGHSHRRAVLLLYFWTALLAFGGTAVSVFRGVWVWVTIIGAGVLLGIVLLVVPRLTSRRRHVRAADHSPPPVAPAPAPTAGAGSGRRAS
jgi:UDP-GlcNAc:undecaprenyl-phosphate/decaprenyl-phosphate GlcNAc-1-phosphate transferase